MKAKNIIRLLLGGCSFAGAALHANTPLLVNPADFSAEGAWKSGANQFSAVGWTGFATLEPAAQVTQSGDAWVFASWDDDVSDRIENFLFQEYNVTPAESVKPEFLFSAGDTIVFKGEASATRVGNDPSNMIVRSFIKMLGYIDGMSHQTKTAQTSFHNIGSANEPFELTITFPDLVEDDSFQLLQIGFEIATMYDGSAMDSGTITFRNLEAYIEGDGTVDPPVIFAGMEADANGYIDTGDFLGQLYVPRAPWVYVANLQRWVYMPDPGPEFTGAWSFMLNQ